MLPSAPPHPPHTHTKAGLFVIVQLVVKGRTLLRALGNEKRVCNENIKTTYAAPLHLGAADRFLFHPFCLDCTHSAVEFPLASFWKVIESL